MPGFRVSALQSAFAVLKWTPAPSKAAAEPSLPQGQLPLKALLPAPR